MVTGGADIQQLNELEIDFLMLADRAEAVNGKLYLMGGAWDRLFVQNFALQNLISIAVGILVPWHATNTQHTLTLEIVDSDEAPIGFRVEAGFAAGTPPWSERGETQRVILALPGVPVQLSRPGQYVINASINGTRRKRVRFTAADANAAALPPARAG